MFCRPMQPLNKHSLVSLQYFQLPYKPKATLLVSHIDSKVSHSKLLHPEIVQPELTAMASFQSLPSMLNRVYTWDRESHDGSEQGTPALLRASSPVPSVRYGEYILLLLDQYQSAVLKEVSRVNSKGLKTYRPYRSQRPPW